MTPRLVASPVFLAALLVASTAGAANRGWLGLEMELDTNALMKVGEATVKRVYKDSPAERAGINAGDSIVEVEGCKIPGCSAPKAKGYTELPPGNTVHLKLRHPDGKEYAVAVVTVPRS